MDNITYEILIKVKNGAMSVDEAVLQLKKEPFKNIGYANIDYHRRIRQGENEVIFGQGKSAEQIIGIVGNMAAEGLKNILITRLSAETYGKIKDEISVDYFPQAEIGVAERSPLKLVGNIAVVSAGTSDIKVCEEAAVTAETLGSKVTRIYDVGVSGLHRLLSRLDDLMCAKVVIAVAGMEGALASVVGGLVDCPVIAVPTSVGYGASFEGLAALLAMLNSCAAGVSVVNIDNGFGAGYLAHMINKTGVEK